MTQLDQPLEPVSNGRAGQRVVVAVCTFNERENLPGLLQRIHNHLPFASVLVIDDNSPDGTGQQVLAASDSDPRLHVIIREHERGLGSAVIAAMLWSIHNKYDWLLNLDADHSHDPADLIRLLEKAQQVTPPLDCVVGTRYAPGGNIVGWTTRRRLMSKIVNRFATTVLQLPVSDCSGSLRCYRVKALSDIDPLTLTSNGYSVFEEVLVALRSRNARFGEVPITFHERQAGDSKLTFTEAVRSASKILRLAFR